MHSTKQHKFFDFVNSLRDKDAPRRPLSIVRWAPFVNKIAAYRDATPEAQSVLPGIQAALRDLGSGARAPEASQRTGDIHINETFRARSIYAREGVLSSLVEIFGRENGPLNKRIWAAVFIDDYVVFEEVLCSAELSAAGDRHAQAEATPNFGHQTLHTQADWNRAFDAWAAAVQLVYPHRARELQLYRAIVGAVFSVAGFKYTIRFDADVRKRYAASGPFHMDNWDNLSAVSIGHIFHDDRVREEARFTRKLDREDEVCENWNLGWCEDPCRHGRLHGECCECWGKHRARDVRGCLESLEASRGVCDDWNLGLCRDERCRYGRLHGECCECGGRHRAAEVLECFEQMEMRE